ncbi:flagellar export protein FliJ [Neiella marina]|uniref:Flagellar FliJ protein n=1 Tax=Neiella holothuriorum TaxID=2870530 RepID=A0ABS7EEN1_9GAMM|nr:flagellar export protein FliJ [Neiella holothuriorum]MBW8190802.1 flagellar export protein FliJ [Neiella holothuriorum]
MANIKQLEMIVKLRQDVENKAAKLMEQAQQAFAQQEQQLQTLQTYRKDYMTKLNNSGESGVSGQLFMQYQQFVMRLGDALGRAEQSMNVARQVYEQRRQGWLQARGEKNAIEMLIEREQQKQLLIQNQREQKQMDEFASRSFIRRAQNS